MSQEEFLAYARKCFELVRTAATHEERETLVEMVEGWLRAAISTASRRPLHLRTPHHRTNRPGMVTAGLRRHAAYFSLCGRVRRFILAKCTKAPPHNLRLLSSPRCASSTMCLARASLTA